MSIRHRNKQIRKIELDSLKCKFYINDKFYFILIDFTENIRNKCIRFIDTIIRLSMDSYNMADLQYGVYFHRLITVLITSSRSRLN